MKLLSFPFSLSDQNGSFANMASITGLQMENGQNNAPLEVFRSAEIVLFTTVSETSYIAEVISSFKTMYGEMERTTRDESGHFGK